MPTPPAGAGGRVALDVLRADPARAAVLTDIDGTLAAIAERPEEAAVPEAGREALRALADRFGLVACISGRRAEEARGLVGLEEISYAGNHGLELLLPGDPGPRLDPSVRERETAAAEFLAAATDGREAALGLRGEDKGPIQALHWRGAEDERAAERRARELALAAGRSGLESHWGRKVLELRPVGGGSKGSAVAALLAESDVGAAVYAGDDRTDLDAFRRLRAMHEAGELEHAVCIGVATPESPAEIAEEADLTVAGPQGWIEILESLAS